jgi:hypothetical protein
MSFLRKCQIKLSEIPLSSRRLLRLDFGHGHPLRLRTAKLTHSASRMTAESSRISDVDSAFGNGYARLSEMVSPIPDGVRFATPTDPPNNEKIRYAKAGPTPKSPPGVVASPMEKTSKNSPSAELGMHLP